MSKTNQVDLMGHLGKDAETRNTRNQQRFTVFSLATRDSWKDREGEWHSKTTWHQVVCWGRLVEYASTLTKGTLIQLKGQITNREYVTKSGEKKAASEVRAIQIAKLVKPKDSEAQGAAA